jgi:hypothetical protein
MSFSDKVKDFWMLVKKYKFVSLYLVFVTVASTIFLLLPGYLRMKKDFTTSQPNAEAKSQNKFEELVQKGAMEKAIDILEVGIRYSSKNGSTKLTVVDVTRKKGYLTNVYDGGNKPYKLALFSGDKSVFSKLFGVPNKVIGPPPLPGTDTQESVVSNDFVQIDNLDFVLTTPFYPDVDRLAILESDGKEVVSYSLQNLKESGEKVEFETKEGNVLSISSDLILAVNRVITNFVSDVSAQSQSGFVDVVFLGDNYSHTQQDLYKSDVDRIINTIVSMEPFKSRSSQVLFHTIESNIDLGCNYSGRIIVCDTSKILSVINSAGIPHDLVAVVVNGSTYGGSAFYPYNGNPGIATSYSGQPWSEEVMVHEIGHALGYLEDEYIANSPAEPGLRNCFRSGGLDPALWTKLTGGNVFINGCDYNSWFRSTETSIMRSVDTVFFNPISQFFLNQEMDKFAGSLVLPTPTIVSPTLTSTPTSALTLLSATPTVAPTPYAGNLTTTSTTSTPTPTTSQVQATSTPIPTGAPTATSTLTSVPTPTPTGTPNCFRGLTIWLGHDHDTASPGDTINNHLYIKNNNDVGCGPTALLGISYAYPSVWLLTPSDVSVSVNPGETKDELFTVYIKPEAPTGSNIYQLWVASWGPFNGTINVQ